MICGITRVRNEALIIADTIAHYLKCCRHIVLYDDASTDDTVAIAKKVAGDRLTVIQGTQWAKVRRPEETRHRAIVLEEARRLGYEWALCFDADERLHGKFPEFTADGYTFRLFDGYLTEHKQAPFDGELASLPRMWGPEYRDILILFRVSASRFIGDGNRCPLTAGRIERAPMYVKHYGKCISVEQWEETCAYYSTPGWPDRYRDKWTARMGKAIHTVSDFGQPLMTWNDLMDRPDTWRSL